MLQKSKTSHSMMHPRQKLHNMLETAFALKLTATRLGSSLVPDAIPPNTLSPERVKEFVDKVASVDATAGRQVRRAFDNMTYIDIRTIVHKFERLLDSLMAYAAAAGITWCVAFTDGSWYMKSDVWLALLACQSSTFRFTYADALPWRNISVFRELDMPVEVIMFDDVMYSGGQMTAFLKRMRAEYPQSYACVPYIHRVEQINECVHPALRGEVRRNSRSLRLAETFLTSKELWGRQFMNTTLTYLQGKKPDSWSLPQFLITGESPFIEGSDFDKKFNEAERLAQNKRRRESEIRGLIPDCDDDDRHYCPRGAYKSIHLPRTSYHSTIEIEKQVLTTVVGTPPCLFMDIPLLPEAQTGLVFDFSTRRIVSAAKRLKVEFPTALPKVVTLKIGVVDSNGLSARLEATAFHRLQGITGVPRFYGCVTHGELMDDSDDSKLCLYDLLENLNGYVALDRVSARRDMSWLYEYLLAYIAALHDRGVFLISLSKRDILVHPRENKAFVTSMQDCVVMTLYKDEEEYPQYHAELQPAATEEIVRQVGTTPGVESVEVTLNELWKMLQVSDWELVKRICDRPDGRPPPHMPETVTYEAVEYQRLLDIHRAMEALYKEEHTGGRKRRVYLRQ